jgi:hypothetical protein
LINYEHVFEENEIRQNGNVVFFLPQVVSYAPDVSDRRKKNTPRSFLSGLSQNYTHYEVQPRKRAQNDGKEDIESPAKRRENKRSHSAVDGCSYVNMRTERPGKRKGSAPIEFKQLF